MPYSSTLVLDRATMRQNDTYPPLLVTLEDSNGGAMDLSTATSVTLVLKGNSPSGTLIVAVLTTENLHAGTAQWTPGSTDLATPDTYSAEVAIVWGTGKRQTVPNDYATNPVLTVSQQLNPSMDE
jgi:hypothetical protein